MEEENRKRFCSLLFLIFFKFSNCLFLIFLLLLLLLLMFFFSFFWCFSFIFGMASYLELRLCVMDNFILWFLFIPLFQTWNAGITLWLNKFEQSLNKIWVISLRLLTVSCYQKLMVVWNKKRKGNWFPSYLFLSWHALKRLHILYLPVTNYKIHSRHYLLINLVS